MPNRPSTVYTDGACLGNPGPGGWAWVVPDGAFASGSAAETTNQRMELTAAVEAIRELGRPLEVVSDSSYLVNCFRDGWWRAWLARGWVNAKKQPVANRDLWEPLIIEFQAGGVSFRKVKGHSGDKWNDLADRLAVEAANTQTGRSGSRPPSDTGPPDTSEMPAGQPRTSADTVRGANGGAPSAKRQTLNPPAPPGHLLLVTGHRPPDLGGYDDTTAAAKIRRRLTEIISAKKELHPDLSVLSGMGLGTETWAAEAAREAGATLIPVLAYPNVDRVWPEKTRRRFRELLDSAEPPILLQKREPEDRNAVQGAFARRDAWLRRAADEAVVVWKGDADWVGKMVRTLQGELGEEKVWIVDPAELH